MAGEQSNPSVNLTPDEKRLFSQVLQAADKEGLGVVTGDVALSFFPQRTRVPVDVLGEIWQIADVEDKGFLTPSGFYVVLRLIGYAQAGKPVNAESALRAGPLPKFDGISIAPAAPQQTPAPLQPQGSGGAVRVPQLLADKASQYASLFEESGAQNGLLPGATAKQIFDRAQLPNDVLVRIWNLADTEMRGMLSCTEFIIAMHLLASFRNGSMRVLPQTLPAGLYDAAARRGVPPRPGSSARSGVGSPAISGITRQYTGGPARATSPLSSQSYTAAPLGPPPAATDGWIITPAEKAKYDNQFAKLDTSGKGFVSGDEAVGFFSRSGLSENDLAQIWDLADIKSEGRLTRDEFAVAMYLIVQNVQSKIPIPQSLPANLVPPSMRNAVPVTQKSTAPDFQQPQATTAPKQAQSAAEDLFGLDALSDSAPPIPAPAPTAAPQVPQSTGGSSGFVVPSSPRAQGSPAQANKSAASTMFKPFQPSSSFGQSMVTPHQTGASSGSFGSAAPVSHDDLLGDNDEASRSIGNDSVELGNLSNQASTLTNQISDVKTKRGTTEQAHGQLNSQKRELETRLAQLRQAYEKEARDVRSLEERLSTIKGENTKLQQDLAMLEHTQKNLTEQHEQVTAQLTADQQENARLKEQIGKTNGEISQLTPQIEKAKSDARQQKGLVAINKKQLATVEAERDRLKSEMELATKEHAEATQELADIQNKSSALTEETKSLSKGKPVVESFGSPGVNPASSPLPTSSNVASPAPSTNSMNPFFKRSNTGVSTDRAVGSPQPASSVKSPNHSAFDDFFGPSLGAGSTSTPPPPASFGAFSAPSDRSQTPTIGVEKPRDDESTPGIDPRPRIPPSPPRSRQISSSALPFRSEAVKAPSETSSVGVAAPASRYEGSQGVGTPMEHQPTGPEQRSEGSSLKPGNGSTSELPGAFPEETPLQTPLHTGSGQASGSALGAQSTGNDPFSSNTMTPASARDDFDSAFAGFGDDKSQPAKPAAAGGSAIAQAGGKSTEFPPIEHYDNADSESDSEGGFDDDFAASTSAKAAGGTGARKLLEERPPPADAQRSPPSYHRDDGMGEGAGGATQFPAEFTGLLPAREDPTSPSQPPHSVPSANSMHASTQRSQAAVASAPVKNGFDEFDEFDDLAEAHAADETGGGEDLTASRRDTLDEFNPTFDSPAPSTRATNTTIADTHGNAGSSSFADFENSVHFSSGGAGASSTFGTASQAPSNADWDAMFAGLDSSGVKEQLNGSSALDEAFGGSTRLGAGLQDKPPLARAISTGTEHDDPILKTMTGMGFSRDESLKALEKYDYNINKAVDHLSSKS